MIENFSVHAEALEAFRIFLQQLAHGVSPVSRSSGLFVRFLLSLIVCLSFTSPAAAQNKTRLNWGAVDGRHFYTAECAESAAGPWTEIYKGCANRTVCKNLVSGKEYFFRTTAHNKLGPGAVSDITSTRAK